MDTEWYAVDRDGHVALFESGEAGAMPVGAHTEHETHRDDLAKVVPEPPYRLLDWLGDSTQEHHIELRNPARTDPSPRVGPDPSINLHAHYRIVVDDDRSPASASKDGLGPTLLFLRSLDPLKSTAGPDSFHHAPAAEGVAILFNDLPAGVAWRLHEGGHCLGCFRWPGEGNPWDLHDDLPRRLGLFYYEHDPKAENWISGNYLRREPPDRPLRIEQLPSEIREAIARVRFADLSFDETVSIQPVAFLPCSSWQSTYLDPDGVTVRPIPGREAEFETEEWTNLRDLRIEEPDQGPPRG
jgi:hypothetical protein